MRTLLVAISLAMVCVACGGGAADDDAGAASEETDTAATGEVLTIADFAFADVPSVAAGDEITVENTDDAAHTVTADDGTFDLDVGGGQTMTFVVDTAGTYDFACTIHPSMTATLTVEG